MVVGQDHDKVWVKVEDGNSRETTGLRIRSSADIDDLIDAALEKVKVNVVPSLVTVEFNGAKIRSRGQLVAEFVTSSQNPLLLKCPEGM